MICTAYNKSVHFYIENMVFAARQRILTHVCARARALTCIQARSRGSRTMSYRPLADRLRGGKGKKNMKKYKKLYKRY
jgi:hypothetical protein